jgi:hypothetical protein
LESGYQTNGNKVGILSKEHSIAQAGAKQELEDFKKQRKELVANIKEVRVDINADTCNHQSTDFCALSSTPHCVRGG